MMILSNKQVKKVAEAFEMLDKAAESLKKAVNIINIQRTRIETLEKENDELTRRNDHLIYICQQSGLNPFFDTRSDFDFPNNKEGGF